MAAIDKKLILQLANGTQLHAVELLDHRLRLEKITFQITQPSYNLPWVELSLEDLRRLSREAWQYQARMRHRLKRHRHGLDGSELLENEA